MGWTIFGILLLAIQPMLATLGGAAHLGQASTTVSRVSEPTTTPGSAAELMSLMTAPAHEEAEFYTKAIALIKSKEKAPSCVHKATMVLLQSCRDIDESSDNGSGSTEDYEATMESIKSTYAARLAVCELLEAGADVPAQCSTVMPPKSRKASSSYSGMFFGKRVSDHAGDEKHNAANHALGHCLKSLESRPQWWTSYSNSRQNAVMMCQAARSQIERDEMLQVHKSMTQLIRDMAATLSKVMKRATSYLDKQKSFAESVNALQQNAHNGLSTVAARVQATFSKLLGEFDLAAKRAIGDLSAASQEANAMSAELKNNLERSKAGVHEVQEVVGQVFQDIKRGGSEVAAQQTKEWQAVHNLSTEIVTAVGNMQMEIHISTSFIEAIRAEQEHIERRMHILYDQQERLMEMQTRIHAEAEEKAQGTMLMFEALAAKMMGLQDSIDRTAIRLNAIRTPGPFEALMSRVAIWTVVGVSLAVAFNYKKFLTVGLIFAFVAYYTINIMGLAAIIKYLLPRPYRAIG
ncbi:MAG: hypothetical protein M1823_002106 [Watsoniomyces obsoletus]|nr:MAG: hypothetical protein M1823_002106 [Watsoniomyces obsoletus]